MRIIDKYLISITLLAFITFITFHEIGQLDRKSHTHKHLHSFKINDTPSKQNDTPSIKQNDTPIKQNGRYKVPAFLILGVMKAGSTLLTSLLQNHPQIPGQSKEKHFFDFNQKDTLQSYHEFFKSSKDRVGFSLETGTSEKMALDSTPSYFTLTYIAPNIKKICPWVKLIVILRNPVDRLFSHFAHLRKTREQYRNMSFESFIQKDIDHLSKLGILSQNVNNDKAWEEYINSKKIKGISEKSVHLQISVARGLYYLQLRQWLKYFPKSSILVVNFDELTSENGYTTVYNKAMDFLGLDRSMNKESFSKLVQLKGKYDGAVMDEGTRRMLYDLYAPYNRALEGVLGREWHGVWEYDDNI